ncbi:MAG: hypothetical protein ACOY0T_41325 [Myxococcota bacterium]
MNRIDSSSTLNLLSSADLVTMDLGAAPEAQVAQLLAESARDQRDRVEQERSSIDEQLLQAEQHQVEALQEQADHVRAAGWIKGATMMLSGALGVAAAVNGLSSSSTVSAKCVSEGAGALGKSLEAAGALLGASEDAAAKGSEADAMAAGSAARHLERRLDELQSTTQTANEQLQKSIDAAAQAAQLRAQEEQARLFIRG